MYTQNARNAFISPTSNFLVHDGLRIVLRTVWQYVYFVKYKLRNQLYFLKYNVFSKRWKRIYFSNFKLTCTWWDTNCTTNDITLSVFRKIQTTKPVVFHEIQCVFKMMKTHLFLQLQTYLYMMGYELYYERYNTMCIW